MVYVCTFPDRGPQIYPSEVSALLHLEPSYAHAPGERRSRTGRALPGGMWHISTEGRITPYEDRDIDPHLVWILDHIELVKRQIDALRQREGSGSDIYCTVVIEGNGGVEIPPARSGVSP